MRGVDDQRTGGVPAEPGERRLERPPSDRYTPAVPEPRSDGAGSRGRAITYAALAALAGAVAITVGGGLLAMTAGLLVIAVALGWAVAAALSTSPGDGTRTRRTALAAGMAAIGVALGQLGLWLVARQEGGTLGLIEYLGEVFGILVLLQLVIAVAVAWWRAR
jgi:hypothetical protein